MGWKYKNRSQHSPNIAVHAKKSDFFYFRRLTTKIKALTRRHFWKIRNIMTNQEQKHVLFPYGLETEKSVTA